MIRKAISLIELVFAIIVMGIAVMTLPLMLEQTQKSNTFSIQQEGLLIARTQLGDITTYQWDENSLKDNKVAILDANLSDSELQRSGGVTSQRRIGHLLYDKRRKFFDSAEPNNEASSVLGIEGLDINDIDDFSGGITTIVDSGDTTAIGLDYKFGDLNMTTQVFYISDDTNYSQSTINFILGTTPITTGTTNIKLIQLSLQGTSLDGNITLRSYATNIGESELLRRAY